MNDATTVHEVTQGIRRMVLDHAFTQFFMAKAPAAAQVGSVHPETAQIGTGSYFELFLEGRAFLVHVSERRSP